MFARSFRNARAGFVIALSATACASSRSEPPATSESAAHEVPSWTTTGSRDHPLVGRIWDAKRGAFTNRAGALEEEILPGRVRCADHGRTENKGDGLRSVLRQCHFVFSQAPAQAGREGGRLFHVGAKESPQIRRLLDPFLQERGEQAQVLVILGNRIKRHAGNIWMVQQYSDFAGAGRASG
jgi:hypothetical protein